ncbi:mannose-1-phosphate guanylyltransferase [Candidatus Uhrbacteria bacterium]|nr:mannose-1-phosphate guanylyltransferase [Candidatus Uhrbacteria bacterium]
MKAVILAGGVGTRLWPMSRQQKPKQFFELVGDKPLIRETYERLLRLLPTENIYFSISLLFEKLLHETLPEISSDHILIEPEKRDTGPAMGYVAALMELLDPDEPIVFIPSDHHIKNEELFLRTLHVGERLVLETGKLLDIAVVPTFPSSVYGYTRIGELYDTIDGIEIYRFAGHTEKPPYEVAKQYLEEGSYLWHASYYMWTPRKFMEAFETYTPEMGKILREIQLGAFSLFSKLPKTSFDYAVTEKMNPQDVLIMKGNFGWSDVGTWDSLHDHLSVAGQNVTKGKCLMIDTHGSLAYAHKEKLIAVLGMEDVVVIDTDDALLVCPKSRAQEVKKIVSQLLENGEDSLI